MKAIGLILCFSFILAITSKKFFHNNDFEDIQEISEEVIKQGYTFNHYNVTTSDGYILSIWRINSKSSKPLGKVIILQHGLLDDAYTFYGLQKNYSLAYILADRGYDVWTPNVRGTIFSYLHTNKSLDAWDMFSDYWNFTFDDMANKDLPTIIDFIKEQTHVDKVDYIGHSQGSTMFIIKYMNDRRYLQDNINKFIALGPVPNVSNAESSLIKVLKHSILFKLWPGQSILFASKKLRNIFSNVCAIIPNVCGSIVESITAIEPTKRTNYEKYISHLLLYEPGGSSKKNLEHWLQCAKAKKMQLFDYGEEENLKKYGTEQPPEYNKYNIRIWSIPSIFTITDADTFSSQKDIMNFYYLLNDKDYITLLTLSNYNHLDYLWSEDAKTEVYDPVIRFLLNTNTIETK